MSYAKLDYYKNTYAGKTAADATLTAYLNRAARDLDLASMNRIVIADMEAEELAALYDANCAQAEFYVENGTGAASSGGSASLGSFSYSGDSSQFAGGVSKRAFQFLMLAGLTNRAIATSPTRRMQDLNGGGVIPETRTGIDE